MDDSIAHLIALKAETKGYWAERILAELDYALRLSRAAGRRHDAVLRSTIESLASTHAAAGAITRETVEETEAKLQALAAEAKSFTVLCVAHAHIDMNWLWRFDETVAVALDTFRTMLTLMTEYPGFTFSQSQASVYRIVEDHDPEMLREIRRRVKEGRWEVTASTWVEADKNIPCGESFARHALYAKRYLAKLLEIAPESLQIDFEPDTFGHSRNIPEILARAGVRWYYHCRGSEEHTLYRWQAPSGAQVIAYRDPFWYNAEITPTIAQIVPEVCKTHGMDTMLRVYGVGDHGGGPTRRDIERIIDMDAWPLFPRVRFGTMREFFGKAEKVAERLPVVNRELNFVFTGCYTTQSRIKAANRRAENRLVEAETFAALASLVASSPYRSAHFARAWEAALFNHFHDIIPGSGIADTREYARGAFQTLMAAAGSEESAALRKIAAHIDTSSLGDPKEDARATSSEGAGVGFGVSQFRLTQVERGRGRARILHVFNPLPWERSSVVEAVVWDWPGDPDRVLVKDAAGNELPRQILPSERQDFMEFLGTTYWGHQYMRVAIPVSVPGCGYTTISLTEATPRELPDDRPLDPRVEKADSYVLENELLRARFDPVSAALVSLVDKETGEEMIDAARGAGIFRLVQEDDAKGMTAWTVGRWMSVTTAHGEVRITPPSNGGIRQSLAYEARFGASRLKATVSLDKGAPALSWSVECEWLEVGRKGSGVPQLNFFVPLAGEMKSFRYDVPFGTVDRPGVDMDLPANGWVMGLPKKQGRRGLMLIADDKHGFRCVDNSISLTLLRSSFDPDPYPELGGHRFGFALRVADVSSPASLVAAARERALPLSVLSGTAHDGSLPLAQSFLALDGAVGWSAAKMPEQDSSGRLVVRLYETEGKKTTAALKLFCAPARATLLDLNEHPVTDAPQPRVEKETVSVELEPHTVATVAVQFEGCRE
jgi:alpha-mannosidase